MTDYYYSKTTISKIFTEIKKNLSVTSFCCFGKKSGAKIVVCVQFSSFDYKVCRLKEVCLCEIFFSIGNKVTSLTVICTCFLNIFIISKRFRQMGYLLTLVICSFILYIKSYSGNTKNFLSCKYLSLFLIYIKDIFRTLSNI